MPINIWRVGVRRMGPSSFQWCPATGQGAMGTKWSTGSSVWTWGRTSSLWGWRSTGTGCPGRLWSLLLWRYSRPAWTGSSAAYCRWPCFSRRVGLDDPQRSLPTPTILWFCDSVIPTEICSPEVFCLVLFFNVKFLNINCTMHHETKFNYSILPVLFKMFFFLKLSWFRSLALLFFFLLGYH